jgi:hypothetical protein
LQKLWYKGHTVAFISQKTKSEQIVNKRGTNQEQI